MSYKSVVLIKQVPDTKNISGEVMKADGTVNRSALPAIFNPEDLNALEMALEVRDEYGGSVTVLTMGPPRSAEILRASLFRGADEVVLLTDRRFAGADTLATAYALSKAVEKVGDVDLVFCGRQAIDGDTAQVGPQVAECLGIPQITYAERVESLADGHIQIHRSIEDGYELLESRLPVLLTVLDTANEPRYPNAKRLMKYKTAKTQLDLSEEEQQDGVALEALQARGLEIPVWNVDDIGANTEQCGLSGSPTKVAKVESVQLVATEIKNIEPTPAGVGELIHELIEDHTLG
jgi:electron transfer flavoprotein beta subunit